MSNHPQYASGTPLTVGTHTAIVHKYISCGGFAQVYKVEISPSWTPPNSTKPTSIACLKRVIVPDKQHLNTLRAEVDSMKRLAGKSKHIVSYFDSHAARMSNGQGYEVFVLMELCENKGLIDFMNTRLTNRLTEQEVLRIMGEVTEGICVMHCLDPVLIHRDIKIENVLLASDGSYKVCDFGSASPILRSPRNEDEMKVLSHDLMSNTTPQYRAPEMLDLTQGYPINEKADIWALGVFLYKLCYYTTPFEEGGDAQILSGRFRYLDVPRYSERMKNLISVLLRLDPRRRPNTYQVLEEVCKMRGVSPSFEDPFKKKKVEQQKNLTVPIQNMPNSNSTVNLNSLNNMRSPPLAPIHPQPMSNLPSRQLSSSPQKGDSFERIKPVNSTNLSRPTSMYNSITNSFNNMNINNNSPQMFNTQQQQQQRPLRHSNQLVPLPPRPKYVDSVTQTDQEEEFKLPNRPARPLSMYSTKAVSVKSTDSMQSTNSMKSDLQRQINTSLYTPQYHEFQTATEKKNWESTSRNSTGGSFKSLRRISSGAGKMIDQLTGKLSLSRGHSRSSSRNSSIGSIGEFNAIATGSNTTKGLANQMRKSSESNYDNVVLPKSDHSTNNNETPSSKLTSVSATTSTNTAEDMGRKPSIKRSGSIQRRISAFLSKASREDNGIPIVKTAKGYGTDETTKDNDGFRKPSLPGSTMSTTRNISGSSVPPQKQPVLKTKTTKPPTPPKPDHLKSKAPPKPVKPTYLKSSTFTPVGNIKQVKNPPIPDRPKGNFPNLRSVNSEANMSSSSDSDDDEDNEGVFNDKGVDEYEKSFHDKFPPASSVF